MDSVRRILEEADDQADAGKVFQVHYIVWSGKGGSGTAWVETKQQANQILDMLRARKFESIQVETHLIPRSKSCQVKWLNRQRIQLGSPFSAVRYDQQPEIENLREELAQIDPAHRSGRIQD